MFGYEKKDFLSWKNFIDLDNIVKIEKILIAIRKSKKTAFCAWFYYQLMTVLIF